MAETKEIHFYVDGYYPTGTIHSLTWTRNRIKEGELRIKTTQVALLSFDLIDAGYEVYLHSRNNTIHIREHMGAVDGYFGDKDISHTHNLSKMLLGGAFDESLNIEQ